MIEDLRSSDLRVFAVILERAGFNSSTNVWLCRYRPLTSKLVDIERKCTNK